MDLLLMIGDLFDVGTCWYLFGIWMDLEGFLRFFLQPVAFHRFGIRDLLGALLDLGVFSKQTCGKIMSQGTGQLHTPGDIQWVCLPGIHGRKNSETGYGKGIFKTCNCLDLSQRAHFMGAPFT